MLREKKVVAAITGAILQYFQAEQMACAQMSLDHAQPLAWSGQGIQGVPQPGCTPSPWSMAGRQLAMEQRQLLQLRMLR